MVNARRGEGRDVVRTGIGLALISVMVACSGGDGATQNSASATTTAPAARVVFSEEASQRGITGEHAPFRLRMAPSMNGGGALIDIDGDADLDLYRTMYNQPNQLLLNDGSGHFAAPPNPSGLEVEGASGTPLFADFDGDGDLDAFITPTNYGRPYLLVNEDGTFTDQTDARGIALEFRDVFGEFGSFAFAANTFDFDHDGDLDILVGEWGAVQNVHGRGDTHRSYAFVNDGAGRFTERADDLGLAALRDSAVFGFAWMDLDGDTWEELLVAGALSVRVR